MKLSLAAAAGLAAAAFAPAAAQDAAGSAAAQAVAEARVNQLIVYGADPCPPSTEEEITVCFREDEGNRFRIPRNLRDDPNDTANQAWGARATELQYVGRSGIGSCSPTGPGGMIGCYNDLVRQARAERAGRDSVNWNRLIEEARQERLSKIDQQAAEDEANAPR
jgi:hypothetical protein